MPNNHYRHRHKRVEEIVGEELMKFYSKPKLLGENPKKIIAVTAKLANEINRALGKSAVARDTRKTGNVMLSFNDDKKK